MDIISEGFRFFIIILIFIIIAKFYMQLVNWIGEILGIYKLVTIFLQKFKKKL